LFSAFCPRENWGESKNKKEGVGEGKEGNLPFPHPLLLIFAPSLSHSLLLIFALAPFFAPKTAENPILRSLLHGNACYAGYVKV